MAVRRRVRLLGTTAVDLSKQSHFLTYLAVMHAVVEVFGGEEGIGPVLSYQHEPKQREEARLSWVEAGVAAVGVVAALVFAVPCK